MKHRQTISSTPRRQRWIALVVAVALVVAMFSTWATAQQPGIVTVTPSSDLIDGQYVRVDWSGFPADGLVYLRQCKSSPKSVAECTDELINGITRSDGSGTSYFRIATGLLDEGFSCDYRRGCSIGVFIDDQDVATAAFGAVTFAFPATDCPQDAAEFASGSGASSVQRLMLRWLAQVCLDPYDLSLSYALKNSVDGRLDYISGLTDYAMTASPMTESELEEAKAAGKQDFAYAPMSLSGLSFAYNVFDRKTGERITDLKLTPELLAEIFTGQIANWNDPRIKALNPDRTLPSILRAIGRADNSASTLLVTSWFDAMAQEAYEAGGPAFSGPTDLFPSTGDIDLRTGAATVAREIAAPSQDSDFTQFGFIGWVDSSYADLYGLPSVAIENGAGAFVTPTEESLQAALAVASPAVVEPFLVPNFASTDPAAYPLLTLTTMIAPTGDVPAGKARILQDFLRFAAGPGQDALPAGYIALSPSLRSVTEEVADAITIKGRPSKDPGTGPVAAPEGPGGFDGGAPAGGFGSTGEVDIGDVSDGGVDDTQDPIALEPTAADAFVPSSARFILPAFAVLMVAFILLGPALQIASRPGSISRTLSRGRNLLARPFKAR